MSKKPIDYEKELFIRDNMYCVDTDNYVRAVLSAAFDKIKSEGDSPNDVVITGIGSESDHDFSFNVSWELKQP